MTAPSTGGVVLHNPLVFEASAAAPEQLASTATTTPLGELLPDNVRTWLARSRLLEGVPFQHIVADTELLPPESIRFFYVDREWTDALVQGALSVGTITTLDREQLQVLHAAIRDEVDAEERRVRMVGGESVGMAPAGSIGGFLLRSRAVSGWPALHVRAYREDLLPDDADVPPTAPHRMRLLRLERLAPAVLLCLFDGVPAVVHIEEPRQGVQYGVDLGVGGAPTTIPLRDLATGQRLGPGKPQPWTENVPFRKGSPGVINVFHLGMRIYDVPAVHATPFELITSGEMAMELLQFPFRQVFGEVGQAAATAAGDDFRPTIGAETVRAWEEEEPT